jgi:hypothetical protein
MPIAVTNRWSIPPGDRSTLVPGTYKPGPSTTGVLPGVTRTVASGSVTISTDNTIYENVTLNGRLSIKAKNVIVRNCLITGGTLTPAAGLVNCANAAVSNFLMEDCTLVLSNPHYTWNGIVGHDFTMRRCDVSGTTDLVNVYNTNVTGPVPTGVVIEANWLHEMLWWSAPSAGIVHPSDTETHNDVIQHYGGSGTIVRGNLIDAAFKRQAGHWFVTNPLVEPYVTVPLNSLPGGGPYQSIPDRGTGTEATGRYNFDDDSCMLLNNTYGASYGFVFEDNWCYGGNYAINGGGNPYPGSGVNLGSFKRNKFDRKQGTQGYTLAFLGNWAGHVDAPTTGADANVYEDDGSPITVRT